MNLACSGCLRKSYIHFLEPRRDLEVRRWDSGLYKLRSNQQSHPAFCKSRRPEGGLILKAKLCETRLKTEPPAGCVVVGKCFRRRLFIRLEELLIQTVGKRKLGFCVKPTYTHRRGRVYSHQPFVLSMDCININFNYSIKRKWELMKPDKSRAQ
jgi:hypothetical protein